MHSLEPYPKFCKIEVVFHNATKLHFLRERSFKTIFNSPTSLRMERGVPWSVLPQVYTVNFLFLSAQPTASNLTLFCSVTAATWSPSLSLLVARSPFLETPCTPFLPSLRKTVRALISTAQHFYRSTSRVSIHSTPDPLYGSLSRSKYPVSAPYSRVYLRAAIVFFVGDKVDLTQYSCFGVC